MSNLKSHYEISVWRDVRSGESQSEECLCTIGSDIMTSQSRAIEPNFVRNISGKKSFSFKMYKQYIDTITGEKVINPFSELLKNETKVKLYYEDKWHEFYIKNIIENSSTYLYTYQLEDAYVQELSKNGYGVTFSPEIGNNLGSAKKLAEDALGVTVPGEKGTSGWKVESETFVEKVEENLVYVVTTKEIKCTQLLDPIDHNIGVTPSSNTITLEKNTVLLAFYSCCKNKPHRFQFILLDDYNHPDKGGTTVTIDEDRVITNSNCQYFIDISKPLETYKASNEFYLPDGMSVVLQEDIDSDSTISCWYKGKRYGYAITTEYVPVLETYCQVFEHSERNENNEMETVEYYGYIDSEYSSPVFSQNVITNSEFKGATGWTGTYSGPTANMKQVVGIQVDPVYGYFDETQSSFISVQDDLNSNQYDDTKKYTPYLQMVVKPNADDDQGILMNSGFYDNRHSIKLIQNQELWYLDIIIRDAKDYLIEDVTSEFEINLREVEYDSVTGGYNLGAIWGKAEYDTVDEVTTLQINYPDNISTLSSSEFINKNIRLVIKPKGYPESESVSYYIEKLEMYRAAYTENGDLIVPGDFSVEGKVQNNYVFVKKADTKSIGITADELEKTLVKEEEIDYGVYVPKYNEGAEKIRTIEIAESNYFNVLQTIAEIFECWLDIQIEHDNTGRVIDKKIVLKNYEGNINYASFRYGVNLKDIERTFESKQMVTKLIVKENNNELGKDGFCTIARAGSNPTGENYIYDFQYFEKMGMLDSAEYLAQMYYNENPLDSTITGENNDLQNYFNKLKVINNELIPINQQITNYSQELLKLKADKSVQEGLYKAAQNGLEETKEKFYALTGLYPSQINVGLITKSTCIDANNNGYDYESLNPQWQSGWGTLVFSDAIQNPSYGQTDYDPLKWKFSYYVNGSWESYDESPKIAASHGASIGTGSPLELQTSTNLWSGLTVYPSKNNEQYQAGVRYQLEYDLNKIVVDTTSTIPKRIGSHMQSFVNTQITIIAKDSKGEPKATWTVENQDYIEIDPTVSSSSFHVIITGTYVNNPKDSTPSFFIQPNRGLSEKWKGHIKNIKLNKYSYTPNTKDRTLYFRPTFTIYHDSVPVATRSDMISCTIKAYEHKGEMDYIIPFFTSSKTSDSCMQEYITYKNQLSSSQEKLYGINNEGGLINAINNKENDLQKALDTRQELLDTKTSLNQIFYESYSRFIQEGTWISEDYADDDKYYNDAKSVLYNSCYPQVQYNINVIALNKLPGYEAFAYELGDTTYAEDPDFFGSDLRTKVMVTEVSENLDDSTKNSIKVQNFKKSPQDLFQRITATVQQAEYKSGAYEKAVELAEADVELKRQFVTDGLAGMAGALSIAGQTSVIQDENGLTLTDSITQNQMRLIGGAILMGTQDPNTGERKWKTGLTPEGISATLIQAGTINTGIIEIKNGNSPTFKWDSMGITAYDVDWINGLPNGKTNPFKFVRFDKYGIYGIDHNVSKGESFNGEAWSPASIHEIDECSTFALTWEGLKVTGNDGIEARIGRQQDNIISITRNGMNILSVSNDGDLEIAGRIKADSGYLGSAEYGWLIDQGGLYYGNIGEDNSFVLTPYGQTAIDNNFVIGNSLTKTEWAMTIGKNFGVDNQGKLYAKEAYIDGRVVASSGEIGSWEILKDRIWKYERTGTIVIGTKAYYVGKGCGIYPSGIGSNTTVFAIGTMRSGNDIYHTSGDPLEGEVWSTAEFRVNGLGQMFAQSGRIGPFEFTTEGLLYITPPKEGTSTRYFVSLIGGDLIMGFLVEASKWEEYKLYGRWSFTFQIISSEHLDSIRKIKTTFGYEDKVSQGQYAKKFWRELTDEEAIHALCENTLNWLGNSNKYEIVYPKEPNLTND